MSENLPDPADQNIEEVRRILRLHAGLTGP